MKKILKNTALALGTLALLAGCGASEKENSTEQVKLWVPFSGPDGNKMEEIVKKYNSENKDKQINFQIVPQSEYYKTLDLNLATEKNGPDFAVMHGDMMVTYIKKDLLKDLDETLKKSGIEKNDYNENAWNNGNKLGKQYGIPFDTHPLLMYYNKDMFAKAGLDPEKVPSSREEFLAYAKQLTKIENGEYGFVVPTLWPQQFIFPTIVYQNGGEFLKDGKPYFNSPEIIEAATFLADLVHKEKVSPTNVQQDGEVTLFLQGKNAMHFNGPWMEQQWKDAGLNYGVAEVPQLGTAGKAVYANSHNFVIPSYVKDETKLATIGNFIKYLEKNSMPWAEAGQAPVAKDLKPELEKMNQQKMILKELEYVKYSPEIENWGSVSTSLWEELNLILLNKKSPKQGLEDATKKALQFTK